jgi:spermidine dehydrogenase
VRDGITRREFVNGFALSLAASTNLSALEAMANGLPSSSVRGAQYPPALTGMRGSHPGSFEVAHALVQGERWERPQSQVDEVYDLVVVGGGISGLSAAWYFREKVGSDARILIIENHDDFGGHAKRNEFDVDGEMLIGYGGSQNIEWLYSDAASGLLESLGIDLEKFNSYYDTEFYKRRKLEEGLFFDKEHYGEDRLVQSPFIIWEYLLKNGHISPAPPRSIVPSMPISESSKRALLRLLDPKSDFLSGHSIDEKKGILSLITYDEFLRSRAGMPDEVVLMVRDIWQSTFAVSGTAWPAMEAAYAGAPGTVGLGVVPGGPASDYEAVTQHFPDGNASVARLLVRSLVPASANGSSMEDMLTARMRYEELDRPGHNVRIRLNATVIDARHSATGEEVEVSYVLNGDAQRVSGRHLILACYNQMIPHVCPEIVGEQREALRSLEKVPVVFTNVALRDWRAFENLGVQKIYAPRAKFSTYWLEFPVSMGRYEFSRGPDHPVILHVPYVPSADEISPTLREHVRLSRYKLQQMTFADFEAPIFDMLERMLGPGGFRVGRDVAGITVNRWPHGYTRPFREDGMMGMQLIEERPDAPHVIGRRQLNRISIANSDSTGASLAQTAMDSAYRAVVEQTTAKPSKAERGAAGAMR